VKVVMFDFDILPGTMVNGLVWFALSPAPCPRAPPPLGSALPAHARAESLSRIASR
jgi:hypothetical protein